MATLREWLDAVSPLGRKKLVDSGVVHETYIYAIAAGAKVPRAEVAGKIADKLAEIGKDSPAKLPEVTRADLCKACAECPYAKKCLNR